jgi:ferredoxin
MTAAERLYADHGVTAVHSRRIGEAAGQGNVAAVGHHFGNRADLVRSAPRREQPPRRHSKPTRSEPLMKITVDEAKCCGAGQCVLIAPEVFDQRDEDGIVVLLDPDPVGRRREAREAADVCPTAAISLVEAP